MNRIVRVVLLAGLASLTLGISAAHADEHQTAPVAPGTGPWEGREGAWRGSDARVAQAHWGSNERREELWREEFRRQELRRQELRRQELRRESARHQRFDRRHDDDDREWRR